MPYPAASAMIAWTPTEGLEYRETAGPVRVERFPLSAAHGSAVIAGHVTPLRSVSLGYIMLG